MAREKACHCDCSAASCLRPHGVLVSFGNSSGGLDNFTTDIFQKGAQTIDMANEFRRGDLAVYGTQQAVNPVTWTYTPGIRL